MARNTATDDFAYGYKKQTETVTETVGYAMVSVEVSDGDVEKLDVYTPTPSTALFARSMAEGIAEVN